MRALVLTLVAACTSSNYGTPTSQTEIKVSEDGGFAGPAFSRSVHVIGTTASFSQGSRTATQAVAPGNVAEMIHALEDVDFLSLHGDFTTCTNAATDAPTATFTVTLTAGANTVQDYLGCSGSTFDDLQALRTKLSDLSGYTDWLMLD